MPASNSTDDFLAPATMIETGIDHTILLHALFDLSQFSEVSFTDYGIEFPASLDAAVDKRKSDFLAGRALVFCAFVQLQLPKKNIAIGHKRAPIWPEGMSGSISHTRQQLYLVVWSRCTHSVGVCG